MSYLLSEEQHEVVGAEVCLLRCTSLAKLSIDRRPELVRVILLFGSLDCSELCLF